MVLGLSLVLVFGVELMFELVFELVLMLRLVLVLGLVFEVRVGIWS